MKEIWQRQRGSLSTSPMSKSHSQSQSQSQYKSDGSVRSRGAANDVNVSGDNSDTGSDIDIVPQLERLFRQIRRKSTHTNTAGVSGGGGSSSSSSSSNDRGFDEPNGADFHSQRMQLPSVKTFTSMINYLCGRVKSEENVEKVCVT